MVKLNPVAEVVAEAGKKEPGGGAVPVLISPGYPGFCLGEPHRTRTYNQLIKSQLLCQLS